MASLEAASLGIHKELLDRAGQVIQLLDSLASDFKKGDVLREIKFPRIVAVGQETTGKSSVLERIAGITFFPRANGVCTRMPMQFKLKHLNQKDLEAFAKKNALNFMPESIYARLSYRKFGTNEKIRSGFLGVDDIAATIKTHMDQAVVARNGAVRGVISDVMTIKITSSSVPNLTLIDLPGIMAAAQPGDPADIQAQSKRLVASYLQDPHTLVLATVPAAERPRNHVSIGLIQEHRKENSTICVLTMTDHVAAAASARNQFIERVKGTAPDHIQLNGYVAVRNRDSTGTESVLKAATLEEAWFDENFPGLVSSGLAGSRILIKKLVSMMVLYVEKNWVPEAIREIGQCKAKLLSSLEHLGLDPKAMLNGGDLPFHKRVAQEISAVILEVAGWNLPLQSSPNSILTELRQSAATQMRLDMAAGHVFKLYNGDSRYESLSDVAWWFNIQRQVHQLAEEFFPKAKILIINRVRRALQAAASNPVMLNRFERLINLVVGHIENAIDRNETAVRKCMTGNISAILTGVNAENRKSLPARAIVEKIGHLLGEVYAQELLCVVVGQFTTSDKVQELLAGSWDFTEDPATEAKRRQLHQSMATLDKALHSVKSLTATTTSSSALVRSPPVRPPIEGIRRLGM